MNFEDDETVLFLCYYIIMNLLSGLLNMGTHAAWISNTMDKFSGKSAYLYNAKSTLLGSDASSLKYDEVVNLITQYDATDKTS
jgi:hypothetical protein